MRPAILPASVSPSTNRLACLSGNERLRRQNELVTPADITAGTVTVSGAVTNTGDARASHIGGTMNLRTTSGATAASLTFTLPAGTTIRSGDTITFIGGTLPLATVLSVGSSGTWDATWTFTNGC